MRRVFDEDVPVRKMRAEVKRTKAAAEVIKQKEQAKAAELLAPVMPGVRALFDSDVPEAKMREEVKSWYDAGMRLREAKEAAEWHGAGQVLE